MNQLTNYLADQLQKFYRSCMNTAQDSTEISSTQSQVPVTFTQLGFLVLNFYQGSHSFTDKKTQDFSRTFQDPMKNFPGPFWSPWMFKYTCKEKMAKKVSKFINIPHCI